MAIAPVRGREFPERQNEHPVRPCLTELGERRLKERNEAWADRYGDGWPKVEELVEASRELWKQRADAAEEEEQRKKEEQERRIRDAELIAAEQKKAASARKRTTQVAVGGLAAALLVAGLAFWQFLQGSAKAKRDALTQRDAAVQAQEAANKAKKDALT